MRAILIEKRGALLPIPACTEAVANKDSYTYERQHDPLVRMPKRTNNNKKGHNHSKVAVIEYTFFNRLLDSSSPDFYLLLSDLISMK